MNATTTRTEHICPDGSLVIVADANGPIAITATRSANTYQYCTDSTNGVISAGSLEDAYIQARKQITPAMIQDGATLWVEDTAGNRITMGIDRA